MTTVKENMEAHRDALILAPFIRGPRRDGRVLNRAVGEICLQLGVMTAATVIFGGSYLWNTPSMSTLRNSAIATGAVSASRIVYLLQKIASLHI